MIQLITFPQSIFIFCGKTKTNFSWTNNERGMRIIELMNLDVFENLGVIESLK